MSEQPPDVSRENFRIEGSLQLEGTLLPSESDLYDLGSNERRFRDLWLAFPTEEHEPVIHIGDQTFTGTDVINARNVTRLATSALQPYDFIFKTGGVDWWKNIVPLGTPTTVHGYSITDAYVMSEIEDFYAGNVAIDGYNKFDWDSTRLSVFETSGNWNEVYENMQGGNSEIENLKINQQLIVNPTNTDHTITISGGYIHGPNTLYIDPFDNTDQTTKQDITGTVVVLGNLQVEGTTTTINSSEVAIVDKTIELAKDSTTPSQANGAGLTVAGANANITYNQPVDRWEFNKGLKVSGTSNIDGRLYVKSIDDDIAGGTLVLKHANNNTTDVVSTIFFENNVGTTSYIQAETVDGNLNGQISFFTRDGTTDKRAVTIDSQQRVGIGTNNPDQVLTVGQKVNGDTNQRTSLASFNAPDNAYLEIENTTTQKPAGVVFTNVTTKKWTIAKEGSDHHLYIKNASDTAVATFLQGGNVGIGTTSPAAKLHVPQPSGTIGGSDLSKAAILLGSTTKGIGIDDNEIIKKGSSLVIGTVSNDPIIFKTNNDNNSGMRLTDVGLGIGVTNPSSILELGGDPSPEITFNDSTAGHRGSIEFQDGTFNFWSNYTAPGQVASNATNNLTILRGGNVGIGTTNPAYTLDISGGARFTGDEAIDNAQATPGIYIGRSAGNEDRHISITAAADRNSYIDFSKVNTDVGGRILYDHNSDKLYISTKAANRLIIDNSGNVGIGTTNPKSVLNVRANNSGQGAILTLENSDTSITSNDVIGQIDFYANDASSNGTGAKLNIKGIAESTAGTLTALTFGTSDSTTDTAVERMRIDPSGNVGIGTTNPKGLLELYKSNDNAYLYITADNASSSRVYLGDEDSATIGRIGYNHGYDFMEFYVNGEERMRIDSGGNVGIGTTGPGERLRVVESRPNEHVMARFQNEGNDDSSVEIGDGLVKSVRINSRPSGYSQNDPSGTNFITYLDLAVDADNYAAGFAIGNGSSTLPAGDADLSNCEIVLKKGKVGIGTTNPTETLEINGNLKVTGQIQASDTSGESYSSTTFIIDTDYTAADFRTLEIVGTSNPNEEGGPYADPIHMHVYRGTGWSGTAITEYVYCVHLSPMARTQFGSGTSTNGNDVDVCWVNTTNGVESDSCAQNSTIHKLRLKLVNQHTYSNGGGPNWSIKTTRKF